VPYADDGRYRGQDKALDKSKAGYPVKHQFTKRMSNAQCLHCHNQNHVGADYVGLFERDYSRTYQAPVIDGKMVSGAHGDRYHRLSKDVHAEKGLWCIDCHNKRDVMGDGRIYSYAMEVPKRSCSSCHGGFDDERPDSSISAIKLDGRGYSFTSKNAGRLHPLKLFSRDSPGHHIEAHRRLRCSACHAQWSYQDLGLSLIREDMFEGAKWYGLSAQGDPSLQRILEMQLKVLGRSYPRSRDLIADKTIRGIWSAGWRFRRWELMPLGLDDKGRYSILRPLYQYLVSYVDSLGGVPLDSALPLRGDGGGTGWAYMPYVPHTIAPFGRSCEQCHLNRVAAGLGIHEETTPDTQLTVPSPPAVSTMRLLNPEEQQKLLEPSMRWRKERLGVLMPDR
jgi:hypothetical protein